MIDLIGELELVSEELLVEEGREEVEEIRRVCRNGRMNQGSVSKYTNVMGKVEDGFRKTVRRPPFAAP